MLEAYFRFSDELFNVLSNHVEYIFYGLIGLLIAWFLIGLYIRTTYRDLRQQLSRGIHQIFQTITLAGMGVLLVLGGFLYYKNYQADGPRYELAQVAISHSHWVRRALTVYYADREGFHSVNMDGSGRTTHLLTEEPVKEMVFSPDGRYIVLNTVRQLYLFERPSTQARELDRIAVEAASQLKGVFANIRWAPDSSKFFYEKSMWSPVSSQEQYVLYDVVEDQRRAIISPGRRISSVSWSMDSENLYYLRYEAKDTSVHAYPFEVLVVRIPVSDLTQEDVTRIPVYDKSVPVQNLLARDIRLFLDEDRYRFDGIPDGKSLVNEKGHRVGIDRNDFFYFTSNNWFQKRLFKMPRITKPMDIAYHHLRDGEYLLDQIHWIPGTPYVMMRYPRIGFLVVDPYRAQVGILVEGYGHVFGFYPGPMKAADEI